MPRMIFVNLPVTDLKRSMAFYQAIGATNNPQFTDETAACMVLSDTIHVMLLTHDKWRFFTQKPIVDARRDAQVMLCVTADSKDEVNACVDKAVAAGGKGDPGPIDDYDFMYGRSFEDPDGHMWGVNCMDMAAAGQTKQETA
jgi:uncharacterized protein